MRGDLLANLCLMQPMTPLVFFAKVSQILFLALLKKEEYFLSSSLQVSLLIAKVTEWHHNDIG